MIIPKFLPVSPTGYAQAIFWIVFLWRYICFCTKQQDMEVCHWPLCPYSCWQIYQNVLLLLCTSTFKFFYYLLHHYIYNFYFNVLNFNKILLFLTQFAFLSKSVELPSLHNISGVFSWWVTSVSCLLLYMLPDMMYLILYITVRSRVSVISKAVNMKHDL
jgi:hypothetical protein